jgi:RHS repeat-associated protein
MPKKASDEQRVARSPDHTRYFAGDFYQRVTDNSTGSTVEERFRVFAGDRELAEIVRTGGTDQILYFHTDNVGSVDTITTDQGSVLRQTFDPFGFEDSPLNPEATRAGFAGQQHDRDLGLIDMRGRIYDPLAGSFTAADPLIQEPYWSQGLNRYAYVYNDPLNNTDPTGFSVSANDVEAASLPFAWAFTPMAYAGVGIVGWPGIAISAGVNAVVGAGTTAAVWAINGNPFASKAGSSSPTDGPARQAQGRAGDAAGRAANLGAALANPHPPANSINLTCDYVDCVDASRVPEDIARRAQSWAWLRGPYSSLVGHEAGDTESISPEGEQHLDRALEGLDNGNGIGFRQHPGDTPIQYHHTHMWYHMEYPSATDAENIVGHPGQSVTTFKVGTWPNGDTGTSLNVMWVDSSGALRQAFISPWVPMP